MGSVAVAGLASAALQITGCIGSAIQGLHSLKGKFQDADNTLRLLINQLSTIKGSVSQIRDWAEFNSDDSPKVPELMHGLRLALEGCQAAVDLLSQQVKDLSSEPTPLDSLPSQIQMKNGGKITWNDATMKEHQGRLSGQILALQLLITASQWYKFFAPVPPVFADNRLVQMRLHNLIFLA
jgi:hypothetical protein